MSIIALIALHAISAMWVRCRCDKSVMREQVTQTGGGACRDYAVYESRNYPRSGEEYYTGNWRSTDLEILQL